MANGYYAPFYGRGYYSSQVQPMPDASAQFGQPQMNMPPYNMQAQNTVPTSDLIWVLNENEAASYPVMPGNTVTLWDKNEPVIYLKSVDAQGMPSMRVLEFTERLPEPRRSSQVGVDTGEGKYASAEAFASLRGEVESLREKLEALSVKPASKTRKTEESDNG